MLMVLVPNKATCGAATSPGVFGCRTYCSSGRGLRRDTRGYYQGVDTPGGLAGLVLPLSKCLVHRDSESGRRVSRWRIVFVDRELVMG